MLSRRGLLKAAACWVPCLGGCAFASRLPLGVFPWNESSPSLFALDKTTDLLKNAPEARYWISAGKAASACLSCHSPKDNIQRTPRVDHLNNVKCLLCAQECLLRPGERGKCRARLNVNGTLRSLVYGHPVTIHIDPIEKKPFYHFLPGSAAYSLATSGCPLRCRFCQNWEISQSRPEDFAGPFVPPSEIVQSASSRSVPVVAFTYNEPTVFTEYLTDIARLARKQKLRCAMISCGFMTEAPLTEICDTLDAIKIDLKGFDEGFYRNVSGAELKPVLRSIKQVAKSGVHLEIVNLVVPTLNDSEKMLRNLADWVMGELGPDVPIHFTRFHPDYQLLNLSPTPIAILERARAIAMDKGVHFAFVGNVPNHPGNHTYCPKCGKVVVKRSNFFIEELNLKNGVCRFCGTRIAGVWV
jgi:pyruvate formate lyase activating enzyme